MVVHRRLRAGGHDEREERQGAVLGAEEQPLADAPAHAAVGILLLEALGQPGRVGEQAGEGGPDRVAGLRGRSGVLDRGAHARDEIPHDRTVEQVLVAGHAASLWQEVFSRSSPARPAGRATRPGRRRASSAPSSSGEPLGPVDLRELLPATRSRRPLHLKLLLRTARRRGRRVPPRRPPPCPPSAITAPSSTSSSSGSRVPVSSSNSRSAHARGSSSGSYSPLGIDHTPRSFLAQNGPPGCTSSTSRPPSPTRYSTMPALRRRATG